MNEVRVLSEPVCSLGDRPGFFFVRSVSPKRIFEPCWRSLRSVSEIQDPGAKNGKSRRPFSRNAPLIMRSNYPACCPIVAIQRIIEMHGKSRMAFVFTQTLNHMNELLGRSHMPAALQYRQGRSRRADD